MHDYKTDKIFALFDAGPIGPAWNPGHGHADFLSVEVDIEGHRFIVDPGTYQYSLGDRRNFERAAQSHNGPCWADVKPVQYEGCFRVGRIVEANLDVIDDVTVRGQLALKEGTLSRKILLHDQHTLLFEDFWSAKPETAQVVLIVQGDWALEKQSDHQLLFSAGPRKAQICVKIGKITDIGTCRWSRRYLQSEPATFVILKPKRSEESNLVWSVTSV